MSDKIDELIEAMELNSRLSHCETTLRREREILTESLDSSNREVETLTAKLKKTNYDIGMAVSGLQSLLDEKPFRSSRLQIDAIRQLLKGAM